MGVDVTKSRAPVAADGASVNFGVRSGVFTRIEQDGMGWLVKIHCVVHRLKLVLADSFKGTYFKDVVNTMFT